MTAEFDLAERPNNLEVYGEWRLGPLAYSPFRRAWVWILPGAIAAMMALLHLPHWPWVAMLAVLLLVVPYGYRVLYNQSTVLYMDASGVWVYQGVVPWNRGVRGRKWMDVERVEYEQGILHWLSRSYPVTIMDRFTEKPDIRLEHVWNGREAATAISHKLMEMTRYRGDQQAAAPAPAARPEHSD